MAIDVNKIIADSLMENAEINDDNIPNQNNNDDNNITSVFESMIQNAKAAAISAGLGALQLRNVLRRTA
jgi:hypothetical protein